MTKTPIRYIVFFVVFISMFIAGCKKKPVIAIKFYEHYKNKVYNDFQDTSFQAVFKNQLKHLKPTADNKAIKAYFKKNGFQPHFIDKFLFNNQLLTLSDYLLKAKEDGLNPDLFHPQQIINDVDTINANRFQKIETVYPIFARLEIESAKALLAYSKVMQYGLVNPGKIFKRYFINVKTPDSTFAEAALNTADLGTYLKQIQPNNPVYASLKKELLNLSADTAIDSNKINRIQTVKLNMERLRWKVPPTENRYIRVNIPAFQLQWINGDTILLAMKVCVGEPKPAGYEEQLKKFLISHKIDDRPLNHETPVLNSRITTIQLNPTWSIPKSIAQSETYYNILKSPSYLFDSDIKVYLNGKLIPNPESIHWKSIPRDKIPYTFVQDAGEQNALGKFKFIFDNESSVYLHDTPNKSAFTHNWRAVSHGCVRVEDPLKLTENLIADTNRVDDIRMEVGLEPKNKKNLDRYKKLLTKRATKGFELHSKFVGVKKGIQLFIDYYTCWPDEHGKIQYYYDLYHKDTDLLKAVDQYLSKLPEVRGEN